MAIRMRRGNEADFDPSKMLPGEWAVSTDTKYVRMCFSPGIVLRMATYEAFESDMAEIRNILSQCQNIQTAVKLIQQNVTASELVIENYVKEAKQYRDEAEQFRNEASMFAPEGYEDLVKNVSDNTVKIDTIIEKAELNIKNNAKGNNIHLTDSAESNVVALELYGKTEQNAYTGKNLLDCSGFTEKTVNGVTFTPVYDDNGNLLYVNANGTATSQSTYNLSSQTENNIEKDLYVSGCLDGYGGTHSICISYYDENASWKNESYQTYGSIAIDKKYPIYSLAILIRKDTTVNNVKFYPMISEEVGEYEPYVGGKPSPSPSYPQEIKNVVLNTIKTHGKNLFPFPNVYYNGTGSTFAKNTDGTYSLNGNVTGNEIRFLGSYANTDKVITLKNGNYKCVATINDKVINSDVTLTNGTTVKGYSGNNFAITDEWAISSLKVTVPSDVSSYSNAILKIMICDYNASDNFEPYQSSEITLSEPIELNGFNDVYDVVTSDGVTRRFAEIVFDGSSDENWQKHTTRENVYFIVKSDKKANKKCLCTHYTDMQNANFDTYDYSMWNSGDFMIKDKDCSTLAEWKAKLQSNPMTVVYELATPTTEELQSDFTALKTFYPETYVLNDADCDMSITYTADAKNYIDNKIALLTTAIYNNI